MTQKGSPFGMGSPDRHSLRVVIQQIHSPAHIYRLVVYGNPRTYRPAEFESLDQLTQALHAAVPGFQGTISSPLPETKGTSIVFSGEMELDDSQLTRLGLTCQES